MTPIIGIPCAHQWQDPERYFVNASYIENVVSNGGTPLLIPYMDKPKISQIMHLVDGVLVPGGIDVDASLFGQEPHPNCGDVDPLWDQLDSDVITIALERNIPILAICRGCQILNVVAGGDLIQDIASLVANPIKHTQQAQKWHATHDITIADGSILANTLAAKRVCVNSFHHQAVGRVAPGFEKVAWANDQVIEAIACSKRRYVLGVQWHPELMTSHHPVFRQLFSRLVQEASSR